MANSFLTSTPVSTFLNVALNDVGSGAKDNISFWIPAIPKDSLYYYLGYYATSNYNAPPAGSLMLYKANNDDPKNPCLVRPVDFAMVWECTGNGKPSYLGIYSPVAPKGYLAIGSIAVPDFRNPPHVDQYPNLMCVRADLATSITVNTTNNLVWADHGSGAKGDVTVYQLPNSLSCYAVSGYPSSSQAWDIVL